jgi:hypothetical protein
MSLSSVRSLKRFEQRFGQIARERVPGTTHHGTRSDINDCHDATADRVSEAAGDRDLGDAFSVEKLKRTLVAEALSTATR